MNPEAQTKTDGELVALTLADEANFLPLMQRYEGVLLRYVQRISGCSVADAEDIVQETFIKAYYNLNGFDQTLKFSSWLYRIAHNEAVSHYRRLKSRPQGHLVENAHEALVAIASELDAAEQLDRRWSQEQVRTAISRLEPKYREVIVLRYFEELSYREISDVLRKSEGSIATLINRAKQQLRKQML
jgi:RNA polymerase sigma-70 factor (ECF subfamily)